MQDENQLGRILVKRQLITRKQLERALADQKATPDRLLGHILVENGALSKTALITTIVNHQHLPLAKALLERRQQTNQPLDEHGIPLLRVSTEEAKALALPEDVFPVPPPVPDLNDFAFESETERDLANDAFTVIDQGNLEEARQIITQGLTILPNSQAMQYLVAWLMTMDDKVGESVGKIDQALPDFRNNNSILWLMSYNLQRMNRHREAVDYYQRLLRHHKPRRIWFFAIAYSLEQLHYWAKARQTYTHFIRVTPGETAQTWYARQHLKEIIKHHDTN